MKRHKIQSNPLCCRDAGEIRNIATALQKKNLGIPTDLFAAAKVLKTSIVYIIMPKNIDGITVKAGKHFISLININKPQYRDRFTLAHELGHIALKHFKNVNTLHLSSYSDNPKSMILDREADIFAAELLMPTEYFKKTVETGQVSIKDLQIIFRVSREAVLKKLMEIQEQPKRRRRKETEHQQDKRYNKHLKKY